MSALMPAVALREESRLSLRRLSPAELADAVDGGIARLRAEATVSWERPGQRSAVFALGAAAEWRGEGGLDGPRLLARTLAATLPGASRRQFRAFVAAAFDPGSPARDAAWSGFGAWRCVVPRLLLELSEGAWSGYEFAASGGTLALPAPAREGRTASSCGLEPGPWAAAVAEAVRRIEGGEFEKVVLARQQRGIAGRSAAEALHELAQRYPSCFVFRFATPGGDWIGASPERLVAVDGGVVRAASLAGSRRRGASAAEDRVLGDGLLRDPKELAEHGVVVRAVREALESACESVTTPAAPVLMRMANIQHLYTPVTGCLRPGVGVLDLVHRLHPTPAVGGWPRPSAMAAIRELEQMDRGWYAGPVGWVDGEGNGEFAVALRSARLSQGEATLYGGAGIVAGSDPERELAETTLKMRPLAEALGVELPWM